MRNWYQREWQSFQKHYRKTFLTVVVLAVITGLLAYAAMYNNPEAAEEQMKQLDQMFEDKGLTDPELNSFDVAIKLMLNNLQATAYMALIGLVPIVILPGMLCVFNMFIIGALLAYLQLEGMNAGLMLLLGIMPHGIFELTAIFYSTAIGTTLSLAIIRSIRRKGEFRFLEAGAQALRSYATIVAPLLIIAGVIEAYVTPWFIEIAY